jgi:thiamine-phosphate pyrophosphorylase
LSCAIKPDLRWLLRLIVVTERIGEGRDHEDVAREALAGGCRAIQLRDKEMSDEEFAEMASRMSSLCRDNHALFFVNDRVEVAARIRADGVHLGVDDMDVGSARRSLPPGSIIGFSPENTAEARAALAAGADYLGVGPVFGSPTKGDAGEPVGLEAISEYSRALSAPVVGVGGVTAATAASVIEAGASGVAVVSAVTRAEDMRAATVELLRKLGGAAPGQ